MEVELAPVYISLTSGNSSTPHLGSQITSIISSANYNLQTFPYGSLIYDRFLNKILLVTIWGRVMFLTFFNEFPVIQKTVF